MARKLVVSAPGGQGHEFPLTSPVTTIGRGRGCDLVLDYGFVSRLHARLEQADDACTIVDCDSTNGTYLNGRRIEGAQPLAPGDRIAIGDVSIAFLDSSSEEATTSFRTMPAGCPVRCDSALWQVWIGDRQLEARLSLQEFELLSLLASRYGMVCARGELGDAIWGRDNFDYNMLHRLVNRLKRKLGPQHTRLIVSVPGRGYRIASQ